MFSLQDSHRGAGRGLLVQLLEAIRGALSDHGVVHHGMGNPRSLSISPRIARSGCQSLSPAGVVRASLDCSTSWPR